MDERWITNQQETKSAVSCSVRGLFIVVLMFFSLFHMGISRFRIGTLVVLLSQSLNSTTSDPRQDGQSCPFTTISLQKVHGMRNCRAYIVVETEKPSVKDHHRLYQLLFSFQSQEKSRWIVLVVVRFKIVPSRRRLYFA